VKSDTRLENGFRVRVSRVCAQDAVREGSLDRDWPQFPGSDNSCRFNRSLQLPITKCHCKTSRRESIRTAALNQNLTRVFDLFDLTPAEETSVADTYKRVLRRCCVDPLSPPGLSECGSTAIQPPSLDSIGSACAGSKSSVRTSKMSA